ncbi:hypothetical protein [Actinoallomurus sp. NPDC052274]|uniref:hypothetical protein n=1 Tax=Actinoallomurus sp. NPDC052274 TaxID=3155420 RepID=UPI00342F0435
MISVVAMVAVAFFLVVVSSAVGYLLGHGRTAYGAGTGGLLGCVYGACDGRVGSVIIFGLICAVCGAVIVGTGRRPRW